MLFYINWNFQNIGTINLSKIEENVLGEYDGIVEGDYDSWVDNMSLIIDVCKDLTSMSV